MTPTHKVHGYACNNVILRYTQADIKGLVQLIKAKRGQGLVSSCSEFKHTPESKFFKILL